MTTLCFTRSGSSFLFGGHRQLAPETPRIHGELLKLGIPFAERTVSRLMPKHRLRPSPTWRTFLANHVGDLVSIDFFTLPTARLRVLSFSSSSLTTAGASSTST